MSRLRTIEWFLIEVFLYFLLWLINDYTATLVSIIFAVLFTVIFVVSLIVELIEPSKVPRRYYTFMVASILAPILTGLVFVYIIEGRLDWIESPF